MKSDFVVALQSSQLAHLGNQADFIGASLLRNLLVSRVGPRERMRRPLIPSVNSVGILWRDMIEVVIVSGDGGNG